MVGSVLGTGTDRGLGTLRTSCHVPSWGCWRSRAACADSSDREMAGKC